MVKIILLLVIVANIVGAGMALMHARNKTRNKYTNLLQIAWGSSALGWAAALLGVLF